MGVGGGNTIFCLQLIIIMFTCIWSQNRGLCLTVDAWLDRDYASLWMHGWREYASLRWLDRVCLTVDAWLDRGYASLQMHGWTEIMPHCGCMAGQSMPHCRCMAGQRLCLTVDAWLDRDYASLWMHGWTEYASL